MELLTDSDPRLREKSLEVAYGWYLLPLMADAMFNVLETYKTGVALAAPQVGLLSRMFIIRKSLAKHHNVHHTIINPIWTPYGRALQTREGCLSFPGIQVEKQRYTAIKVTYQDTGGKSHTKIITDPLMAQIFQHEIEHLDGKLLTDK